MDSTPKFWAPAPMWSHRTPRRKEKKKRKANAAPHLDSVEGLVVGAAGSLNQRMPKTSLEPLLSTSFPFPSFIFCKGVNEPLIV